MVVCIEFKMNLFLDSIFYIYFFSPAFAVSTKEVELETRTTLNEYSTTSEPVALTTQMDAKYIKHPLLMKMLLMATTNKKGCNCNCSSNVHNGSTKELKKTPLGFKVVMRNKPEEYAGVNSTIGRLCPYFVQNDGFRMYKMAAVYWPKFYNLEENLDCFKINVIRLSDAEMKENEFKYGNFSGKVDWSQCHFEIKPPELFLNRRHFLSGSINDRGVMRNILITYNSHGGFTLHEQAPDQWLMLQNLVLLRDCTTGEVVVFTKTPRMTTSEDIVQGLQYLGEEMIGKMLCDEDDDWLDLAS